MNRTAALKLIHEALKEDAAHRDVTSRTVIPVNTRIRARIIAKQRGIAAGVKMAALTFAALDPSLRCRIRLHSGARLAPGRTILTVEGRARSIFAAERTALNFLMHCSGIATLTRVFVDRVRGTRAAILDTRKTLPGLRALEKYAVGAGGGHNHRADLSDAILIKSNHLRAGIGLRDAVATAKRARRFVEVEVRNLREFTQALAAKPDAILLDNWTLARLRQAVRLRKGGRPLLEASGGVTLSNVRAIARTGVDRISIGRLTHSAPALDMALQIVSHVTRHT
jgi:nicotinate-nucleotide pyrophosphorylase (carboxylating)